MMNTRSNLPSRRPNRRGQAAVEAGLGILMLVTVLVFGIHFAEIGYLSIKVNEAAQFATWDATARQITRYGSSMSTPYRAGSVSDAEAEANDRYADFDGRQSKNGSAPTLTFTQANDIDVQCNPIGNPGSNFPNLDVGGGLGGVYNDADEGGMRCRAEADLDLINIGSFHDSGGGFFRADHVSGPTTMTICSTGRAWASGSGSCDAFVPIQLGDWGLSDTSGQEDAECDLYSCTNTRYKAAVETAFNASAGPTGLGTALSFAMTGYAINEGEYWFAFKGEESGFRQALGGVHAGDDSWTVTPGGPYEAVPEYQAAHGARQACFLGFPCTWKRPGNPN